MHTLWYKLNVIIILSFGKFINFKPTYFIWNSIFSLNFFSLELKNVYSSKNWFNKDIPWNDKINVTHTTIFCDIFLFKLLIKVEEKQKD